MSDVVGHVDRDAVSGELQTVVGKVLGYTPPFKSAAMENGIRNQPILRSK